MNGSADPLPVPLLMLMGRCPAVTGVPEETKEAGDPDAADACGGENRDTGGEKKEEGAAAVAVAAIAAVAVWAAATPKGATCTAEGKGNALTAALVGAGTAPPTAADGRLA